MLQPLEGPGPEPQEETFPLLDRVVLLATPKPQASPWGIMPLAPPAADCSWDLGLSICSLIEVEAASSSTDYSLKNHCSLEGGSEQPKHPEMQGQRAPLC